MSLTRSCMLLGTLARAQGEDGPQSSPSSHLLNSGDPVTLNASLLMKSIRTSSCVLLTW